MKIVAVETKDAMPVWTEEDWPAVPRRGETVVFKNREFRVEDVDHDFGRKEIRVWVRLPLGVGVSEL